MSIINMGGGGDCLFRCLGWELGLSHSKLRILVSNAAFENLELIRPWVNDEDYASPEDFARKIRHPGYYGNEIVLALVSSMFEREIRVWTFPSKDSPELCHGFHLFATYPGNGPTINLYYSNEHYQRLVFP